MSEFDDVVEAADNLQEEVSNSEVSTELKDDFAEVVANIVENETGQTDTTN